jgi:DNA-binding NarL/FixJ family response regulator
MASRSSWTDRWQPLSWSAWPAASRTRRSATSAGPSRAGLAEPDATELTVAQAVAEGLSNPQIAARMFISRRTITTHLTSIFHKLGMASRAELAARAARREDQEAARSPTRP